MVTKLSIKGPGGGVQENGKFFPSRAGNELIGPYPYPLIHKKPSMSPSTLIKDKILLNFVFIIIEATQNVDPVSTSLECMSNGFLLSRGKRCFNC